MEGTQRVVFAYNDDMPTGESSIRQHADRGSHSVRLFSGGKPIPPPPADAQSVDLRVKNLTVDFHGHTVRAASLVSL